MQFTPEEITKLKAMMLFLVKKKDKESGGHCGFHITELNPVMEELEKEGTIIQRNTLHCNKYFMNTNNNKQ